MEEGREVWRRARKRDAGWHDQVTPDYDHPGLSLSSNMHIFLPPLHHLFLGHHQRGLYSASVACRVLNSSLPPFFSLGILLVREREPKAGCRSLHPTPHPAPSMPLCPSSPTPTHPSIHPICPSSLIHPSIHPSTSRLPLHPSPRILPFSFRMGYRKGRGVIRQQRG